MKRYILSILVVMMVLPMMAQSARDFIRMGNKAYRAEQYDKAETMYLKSIAKSPSFEAYYNLGNAYVMQQKDSTAFENYKRADSLGTTDPLRRARNFHNMGNIWYAQGMGAMRQQQGNATQAFQRAVDFYKSSLRCNPDDNETRYNLAMAQYMLKKNQDQQQNQQNQQNSSNNNSKISRRRTKSRNRISSSNNKSSSPNRRRTK